MKRSAFIALACLAALATATSCWKDTFYLVTFNTQGGSPVNSQWVREGSPALRPDDPHRDGSTFIGWFLASRSGTEWNFNTPVHSNLTLYAHYITVVPVSDQ